MITFKSIPMTTKQFTAMLLSEEIRSLELEHVFHEYYRDERAQMTQKEIKEIDKHIKLFINRFEKILDKAKP